MDDTREIVNADHYFIVRSAPPGLFDVPLVGLFRYEMDGAATVIAASGTLSPYLGQRWAFPAGDPSILASMPRTGQPLRIDDYAKVSSSGTDTARNSGEQDRRRWPLRPARTFSQRRMIDYMAP